MLARIALTTQKTLVRNMSASSVLLQKADPIQQLFVNKSKEYYAKKSASKTGLVDSSAEAQKTLKDEIEKINKQFGPSATAEFPQLSFEEPKLDSITIEKQ